MDWIGREAAVRVELLRLLRQSCGTSAAEPADDASLTQLGLSGIAWVHFADRFRDRFGRDPARLGPPGAVTWGLLVAVVTENLWAAHPEHRLEERPAARWARRALRGILHVVVASWWRVSGRLVVVDARHVPRRTPLVIVVGGADRRMSAAVLRALPMRAAVHAHPLGAPLDLSTHRLAGALARMEADPVDSERFVRPDEALKAALDLLHAGEAVIVFPAAAADGTKRGRFRHGVGILAARKPFPALPVHVEAEGRRHTVRFGAPVQYVDEPDDPFGWARIALDLQGRVSRLGPLRIEVVDADDDAVVPRDPR